MKFIKDYKTGLKKILLEFNLFFFVFVLFKYLFDKGNINSWSLMYVSIFLAINVSIIFVFIVMNKKLGAEINGNKVVTLILCSLPLSIILTLSFDKLLSYII